MLAAALNLTAVLSGDVVRWLQERLREGRAAARAAGMAFAPADTDEMRASTQDREDWPIARAPALETAAGCQ